MASVETDSSMGSVPLSMLLKAQKDLFKFQHVESEDTSAGYPAKQLGCKLDAINNVLESGAPATVPESADVNDVSNGPESAEPSIQTPQSAQKKRIPRLSPSKSMPTAQMQAMVQSSPSQDALVQLTGAKSFSGTMAPEDTQPFDSQLYTESMVGRSNISHQETPRKPHTTIAATPKTHETLLDTSPNTHNTLGSVMSKTQQTLQEGETGYVDLQWNTQQQSPVTSTQGFEELLESQNPQTQVDAPEKPSMPETPSLIGQKRKAEDELPTSATTVTKTPQYSQAFGFSAAKPPMLTNTQLFQDQSSPLPDAPRSDPIASRPSPTSNELNLTSSPVRPIFSSPAMLKDTRPRSALGEPREIYTSMKESQERRRRMMEAQEQADREARGENLSEDDEFEDSENRRLQVRNMRRAFSEQAKQDAAQLRTSYTSRSRPSSSRKPNAMIDLVTPGTMQRGKRISFEDLSDDELADDETAPEEQHDEGLPESPRHDEEFEGHADDATENDEYDELAQAVLKSQGNDHDEADDIQSIAASEELHGPELEVEQELAADNDGADGIQPSDNITRGTQRSTIADSQPTADDKHFQGPLVHHTVHSFSSSFVPGSHYHQGKTSEEQAIASSQRMAPPTIPASQTVVERPSDSERVPSSPPRLSANSTLPNDTAEASLQRQELLEKFQQERESTKEHSVEQEIPESDLPDAEPESPRTAQDTGNGAPYSTARTHVSASARSPAAKSSVAPSPVKAFASQQSRRTEDSPRKRAGIRRFSSMATNPTSAVASFDAMADVDDVFENVMTDEDRTVLNVTSDPPEQARQNKRRKLRRKRSSNPASSEVNQSLPGIPNTVNKAAPARRSDRGDVTVLVVEDEDELSRPEPTPKALKNSPSKANEAPARSMEEEPKPRSYSSESVLVREKAGSDAVSQLVKSRSAIITAKKTTYGRASRRKSSRPSAVEPVRKFTNRRAPPKNYADEDDEMDDDQNEAGAAHNDEDAARIDMTTDRATEANDFLDDDNLSDDSLHSEQQDEAQVEGPTIVAPKRIFAWFKGRYNGFYPAMWLGVSPDGATYNLRFDDGTVTNIETQHVRSLDIQVGETVRVDKAGLRNKQWVVTGLGPAPTTREERALVSDIYGNIRVQVQAKASRNSLLNGGPTPAGETVDTHVVLISDLYFTMSMWAHFQGREFDPLLITSNAKARSRQGRAGTPPSRSSTPSTETPASRSRRAAASARVRTSTGRTSHLREGSVTSSISDKPTAIFSNMAFAVSYVSNEFEKGCITRTIQRNGGLVLNDGFEQLFELPAIGEAPSTSPNKKTPKKQQGDDEEKAGLRLKDEYKDLGFVAVIADKHSRRAKYMQALALGLPTLSGRWIAHSMDASKNATLADGQPAPLPWDRYLLPAGESSYLGGAVRSRLLNTYDTTEAQAGSIIPERALLLNGDTVLIVAPKKGKSGWDKRKTYAFLTLALGAGKVQRVNDLQEAKDVVQADPESATWVYVDGAIAEAEKALFGSKAVVGKKRKRGGDSTGGEEKKHSATSGNVRIVDDEFVVQSLILGALID